jgi:hypothetical protein
MDEEKSFTFKKRILPAIVIFIYVFFLLFNLYELTNEWHGVSGKYVFTYGEEEKSVITLRLNNTITISTKSSSSNTQNVVNRRWYRRNITSDFAAYAPDTIEIPDKSLSLLVLANDSGGAVGYYFIENTRITSVYSYDEYGGRMVFEKQ